jgi:hypothetical protein
MTNANAKIGATPGYPPFKVDIDLEGQGSVKKYRQRTDAAGEEPASRIPAQLFRDLDPKTEDSSGHYEESGIDWADPEGSE